MANQINNLVTKSKAEEAVPQTPTHPATNALAKINDNLTLKQKEEMIK